MKLSGWGRYPVIDAVVREGWGLPTVAQRIAAGGSLIACGALRAYGDAALNAEGMLMMRPMDRLLAFDADTGLLTCEAGITLSQILDVFVPRGWFPTVTPGTRFVTVGGAIASDVHGKNHHCDGGFGAHVHSLDLALADGRVVSCARDRDTELFFATVGGMGLTGVILRATIGLRPIETAWIRQETRRTATLAETMEVFEQSADSPYSVAWIDALASGDGVGRSVVMLGRHATRTELPQNLRVKPLARRRGNGPSVPFALPDLTLNDLTVRAFNALYYRKARPGGQLVDLDGFFYPLDAIGHWNRIYGRRGFLQYQCVLPRAGAGEGLRRLLTTIASAGGASFLAVLKLLGGQGDGLLSFPFEGYTLALDFPVSPSTLRLMDELDAIVADFGGRLYLAKDARMSGAMLRRGYPRIERFQAIRRAFGADTLFQSRQSQRLSL